MYKSFKLGFYTCHKKIKIMPISLIRNNHCESEYEFEIEFQLEFEVKLEVKSEFKVGLSMIDIKK